MKGFLYTLVGWLGIEVLSTNNAILIRIPEGSHGWYLLLFINFFFLFYGMYSIYKIIKSAIRCYQFKNFRKIKQRQKNANCERNQNSDH